jgi:hypothetical protein
MATLIEEAMASDKDVFRYRRISTPQPTGTLEPAS